MRIKDQGASLVEVIMAMGLMGILSIGIMKFFDNNNRLVQNTNIKMDKQAIILDLQSRAICPDQAILLASCGAPGVLVDLKDAAGKIIVSKSGSKFGHFTVRAECNSSKNAIVIRLTRLSDSGTVNSTADADFKPDPLTSKIIKWTDPGSLGQPVGTNFCSGSSNGATTWVAMEYDGSFKVGWQLFSLIKGNLSPDQYCISKGFKGAGGECKHDNVEPPGYNGQDWGSGFSGQASYQATKFTQSPFNGRWGISCPTHYFQKPDFITCNN